MEITLTTRSLLERVQDIASTLREHAADAERERRLPRPVVEAMLEAELYRMSRPEAFGGLELDPVTMFRVVEEVALHNSAAAWNLQISVASDWFLAWLPDEGAAEVLDGHPDVVLGASFTPTGQAVPVEGGYRVTGRWPFVSGAQEADWYMLAPFVMDGERPGLDGQGNPIRYFMYIPAEDVQVLDTWHTLGLRGTGSHDVELNDLFVPARHTAPLVPLEQPGRAYGGPLYRMTVWPPIGLLAPPALGVARAAINELIELARTKSPTFTGTSLRTRQVVQRQVAEADATLRAGRALLYETFQENWEAAVAGATITLERKMQMQLATSHANVSAARAVGLIHEAAGTSAVRNTYPFQQHFRDVHTMTQHAASSACRYESIGALMLGEASDWPFFGM